MIPESWCLTGTFDWIDADELHQRAEGKLYITAYQLVNSPLQLGLAIEDGKWDDGNTKYKWTYNQPVRISMRKEAGGNKLKVTITRLTELPVPATGAVSPPPAASPGRATAEVTRSNSTATPVAVPPSTQDGWYDLARNYKRAVAIAIEAWLDNDGTTPEGQAMVAAAATVFIEANKRGLTVPPPPFTEMPAAITRGQEQDDEDLPF